MTGASGLQSEILIKVFVVVVVVVVAAAAAAESLRVQEDVEL